MKTDAKTRMHDLFTPKETKIKSRIISQKEISNLTLIRIHLTYSSEMA